MVDCATERITRASREEGSVKEKKRVRKRGPK
jgi:hypothetical protein